MAEYGSGISFEQACKLDRERIQHALKGEVVFDETDKGFIYTSASKNVCDDFILSAYDEVVHQALQGFHSGRALEYMLAKHGIEMDLKEYMEALEKTKM